MEKKKIMMNEKTNAIYRGLSNMNFFKIDDFFEKTHIHVNLKRKERLYDLYLRYKQLRRVITGCDCTIIKTNLNLCLGDLQKSPIYSVEKNNASIYPSKFCIDILTFVLFYMFFSKILLFQRMIRLVK